MLGLYGWRGSPEDFSFWNTYIGLENAIRLERRERDQELTIKIISQQIDAFVKGRSPVFPVKELDPGKLQNLSNRAQKRIAYIK